MSRGMYLSAGRRTEQLLLSEAVLLTHVSEPAVLGDLQAVYGLFCLFASSILRINNEATFLRFDDLFRSCDAVYVERVRPNYTASHAGSV